MTALWRHHLEQVGVVSEEEGGWVFRPSPCVGLMPPPPAATPALSPPYLTASSFSLGTEAEQRPRLNDFLPPSRNVDVYLDGRREPGV